MATNQVKPLGVLILHGFTSGLNCVNGMEVPLKALGIPVSIPVLRGHGAESPDALRGVVWQDWVADAEAALEELLKTAEKVIVVGHSMGALVALTVAANHQQNIDSMVLAAPAIQLSNPLAPGRKLHFLTHLLRKMFDKWPSVPIYADRERAKFSTNYRWAPTDSIVSLFNFIKVTRKRLQEIKTPLLILHSHHDSVVSEQSIEIIFNRVATAEASKRVAWLEKSDHELFLDCERDLAIQMVVDYIRERIAQ